MERIRNMVRWVSVMSLAGVLMALSGCMSYGPAPQTVAQVEVPKYMGLWHEIASNPQFFNEDLGP